MAKYKRQLAAQIQIQIIFFKQISGARPYISGIPSINIKEMC